MNAPDAPASPEASPFPEETVDAGVYATHAEGFERGVVVLAMGEACWLIEAEGRHHLRVSPSIADAVRHQLACYDRECVSWPPRPTRDIVPVPKHVPLSPLLWVLSIFAAFWAQGARPGLTDAALLDADRVFNHGEWWRAVSALWLHGDVGHLVANAGGGLLVFTAVVATFGFRAGWWSLAGAAILGNAAAVILNHGQPYRSLGASTAVFAALGLLTGRAVRVMSHARHPQRWRTLLVPSAAGLAVLGLLGAGGVNIDVLAHATGFAAGGALGFAVACAARN